MTDEVTPELFSFPTESDGPKKSTRVGSIVTTPVLFKGVSTMRGPSVPRMKMGLNIDCSDDLS